MLWLKRRFAGVGLILCCALRLSASPVLTTIQDTLYNADGSLFNGVVIITWPPFVAADGSQIAAQTLTVPVPSGYFLVSLAPTVGASTAVTYSVRISSGGINQSTQLWSVPSSSTPLTISQVMVVQTGGIVIGSGGTVGILDETISISDVVGLTNALALRTVMGTAFAESRAAIINSFGGIDGAAGTLSDCVHVDGTSGSCGAASVVAFVDSEVPAGNVDGTNTLFTLTPAPFPTSSVAVWRNGVFLTPGVNFTVSGSALTFPGATTPQIGDIILASYRSAAVSGVNFADAETPGGLVNGANATFTLANVPNPGASLALYRNGLHLEAAADYTLNGSTITFLTGQLPQTSDILLCSYRY
jgi:hypothetical protein